MGEGIEGCLGLYIGGLDVLGDLVERLPDTRVIDAAHDGWSVNLLYVIAEVYRIGVQSLLTFLKAEGLSFKCSGVGFYG